MAYIFFKPISPRDVRESFKVQTKGIFSTIEWMLLVTYEVEEDLHFRERNVRVRLVVVNNSAIREGLKHHSQGLGIGNFKPTLKHETSKCNI
jgi:hypothetical protein